MHAVLPRKLLTSSCKFIYNGARVSVCTRMIHLLNIVSLHDDHNFWGSLLGFLTRTASENLRLTSHNPDLTAPSTHVSLNFKTQWRVVQICPPEEMRMSRHKKPPKLRDKGIDAWIRIHCRLPRLPPFHPTKKIDKPRLMKFDTIMTKRRICHLLKCPRQAS